MTEEIKPVEKPALAPADCSGTSQSDPEHRFTGLPLQVEYIDGIEWTVMRDVSYKTEAGETSTVREGFVTDFASIPRVFFWALPPAGLSGNPYGLAALFHDWGYTHKAIGGRPVERWEIDALFLEIMRYVGVGWVVAHTMYRAVRMWGWTVW